MSFIMIAWGARNDASDALELLMNCSSAGCTAYETFLRNTLDTNTDPCENCKAFVTSRWLPHSTTAADTVCKIQWGVKFPWMNMLGDEIRHRRFSVPMMNLVASSYTACENPAGERSSSTRRLFKEPMQDLGVPWPETPVPTVPADVLDVVIKLCINWQVPLWFDIKMLPEKTSRNQKILYIGPNEYAKL